MIEAPLAANWLLGLANLPTSVRQRQAQPFTRLPYCHRSFTRLLPALQVLLLTRCFCCFPTLLLLPACACVPPPW